jgi:glycosyltransferase involved in cell wall biosynthesis
MRLLVFSHPCATPVNQELYAEVDRASRWEISLVVPSNWRTEYGKRIGGERWPAFKGELIAIPVWLPGNVILHAYRASLGKLLRQVQPDAIYVHHEPYAAATAQVYRANARTLRRPIGFYSAQNIQKRYPLPFRAFESRVMRQSSFFFPISPSVDDVFRRKGYAGPSTVVPLGIDPVVYKPKPEAAALKRELRKADDEFLIGYVGRIVEEKGLLTLLRAMALLGNLKARLVVVGSGPFEPKFNAEMARLGLTDRVTRIGYVPHAQAPLYLSALDCLVLPSETRPNWKEQFGRVILESLACGTPVIGSDSGEIPRLIQATGGGLIFREGRPDELAAQIRAMASDPALRESFASRGRGAVENSFLIPGIAQSMIGQIERAVADFDGRFAGPPTGARPVAVGR